jgi:hypothetical protein
MPAILSVTESTKRETNIPERNALVQAQDPKN